MTIGTKTAVKKVAFLPVLAALFLGSISHLHAQILFSNGLAALGSGGYGYYADTGSPYYSEAGDVFTPSLSGTAYTVNFAGIYYGGVTPTTDTFVLSLYSTSLGAPNTLISPVTSTLSGLSRVVLGNGESQIVYQFSGNLNTPLALTAETAYYLGITDTTTSYQNFAVDVTAVPGSTSEYSLVAGTSSNFIPSEDSLAFELAVPEPSEWELIVLGCVGLMIARKLRSKFSAT